MKAFDYARPTSLAQAVELLHQGGKGARPLAGGTDLLVQMKYHRLAPSLLVDVKAVPELNRLELLRNGLHIGAAVPLSRIVSHPDVRLYYPAIVQSCALIGSVQVRHRATLGGNLGNAAPSADGAPALICLGARAAIAGPKGQRKVPLEEFFRGPGQTALEPGELLVEVEVPRPPPRTACHYQRFTPRQEMDIAVVGVASLLTLGDRGRCQRVRIALGAVAPTPVRARIAEALLEGRMLTPELVAEAAEAAAADARPITDIRASVEYRRELVRVLTARTLRACLDSLSS